MLSSKNRSSPLFIAEVSSNHHRDLERCLRFVETAADIGCGAVKFQLFKIDQLFAPEILARSEEHRKRKDWELPLDFVPKLAEHSQRLGIQFSCTPFYLDAVKELLPYVDFYKIASYELLWDDLIRACSRTGKPLILSTGMATLPEIEHAVEIARSSGCKDLTLLHCISGYPTPVNECNLAAIETMRKSIDCPVGWSDHSAKPEVLYRALHRWDAAAIEFHLDLEGDGGEFRTGHCWLPDQIKEVIRATMRSTQMDGTGIKTPAPSELNDRSWRADPKDGLRPLREKRAEYRLGSL